MDELLDLAGLGYVGRVVAGWLGSGSSVDGLVRVAALRFEMIRG
jgi:hypothetical protein